MNKATQSERALKDILSIASLGGSLDKNVAEAKKRIERYKAESKAFHEDMPDVAGHVRNDLGTLRDKVLADVQRHPAVSNSTTDLLERVWDHLVEETR